MAREKKTKQIDGVTYECLQFDVKKSLRILTRLSKHLGGPISMLLKNYDGKRDLLEQDLSALDIGGAVQTMMGSLGDDELYDLSRQICEDVIAEGHGQLKDSIFDAHFKGMDGIPKLFRVVAFALEVNYGNFLSKIAAGGGVTRVNLASTSTRAQ